MERPLGKVLALGQNISQERDRVGHSGENDERPREVKEGRGATDRDGAEAGCDNS